MYYDVQKSAERIKYLRIDNNLPQSEAAEKMGFSLSLGVPYLLQLRDHFNFCP